MRTMFLICMAAGFQIGCTFHEDMNRQVPPLKTVVERYNRLVHADTVGEIVRTASAFVDEADRADFLRDAAMARRSIYTGLTTLVHLSNATDLVDQQAWSRAYQEVANAVTELLDLANQLEAINLSEEKLTTIKLAIRALAGILDQIPELQSNENVKLIPPPSEPEIPWELKQARPLSSHIIGVLK